ncbi:MAG: NADH-quinone oxidoreductase subunit N [Acidobacteriota bacterium]
MQSLFNPGDLAVIGPEIGLTIFACLVLLPSLFRGRRNHLAGHLSIALAVAALGLLVFTWVSDGGGEPVTAFGGAFVLDRFSQFFKIVVLLSAILAMGMSVRLLDEDRAQAGEYYALVLFACVGTMFMVSGLDLLVIWLGLELLSLSSYVLCGFLEENRKSSEAALKYFLLGAFSSGILLYGISLIYGTTGSTLLPAIRRALDSGFEIGPVFQLGVVLMVAGFAFKVAAVPFHQWAPDVYEGAPTGITAFISTASKGAAFAAILRIFTSGLWSEEVASLWVPLLVVLATASMVFGNVAALLQNNVKRMLAYSSIGHAGYILMGCVAIGSLPSRQGGGLLGAGAGDLYRFGVAAVLVYVLVYTFSNVGAFGVVASLRRSDRAGERVADFNGLARNSPLLAFCMLVFLLSLAGIPATAGFIGKWYLFGAALRADYAWMAVIAVSMSTVSVYYYLRVVVAMYMRQPDSAQGARLPVTLVATLAVAVFFTLLIGLFPQPFLDLATEGAGQLRGIAFLS